MQEKFSLYPKRNWGIMMINYHFQDLAGLPELVFQPKDVGQISISAARCGG
jgi:hypothetical protein